MSLNIDMKMIRSVNSSGWIFRFSRSCWISWRIDKKWLFHRYQMHPGKTNTTRVLPLDFFNFLLLLECLSSVQHMERNQHRSLRHWLIPISPMKVMNTPNMSPSLCFLNWSSGRRSLKWSQEHIEKFITLSKHKRWSHSSRVKFPLVRMSACWFWC